MYLLSQLWIYLLLAFLLGASIGYWLWRKCVQGAVDSRMQAIREESDRQLTSLRNQLSELNSERNHAVQTATSLHAELAELRLNADRERDTLSHQVTELEGQLKDRDARIVSLNSRVESESNAHNEARRQVSELLAAKNSAEALQSDTQEERDAVRQELEQLAGEILEAHAALKEINSTARMREEELSKELAVMRQEFGGYAAIVSAALETEQRLKSELEHAAQRERANASEIDALRRQLAEAANLSMSEKTREGTLDEEVSELRRQLGEMNAKSTAASQAEQKAQNELARMSQRSQAGGGDMEGLRRDLADARSASAAMKSREKKMNDELEKMRRRHGELTEKWNAAMAAEQELRAEVAIMSQRASSRDGEVEGLRKNLTDADENQRMLKMHAEKMEQELAALRSAKVIRRERPVVPEATGRTRKASSVPDFIPSAAASMSAEQLEKLVLAAGKGRKPNGQSLQHGEKADDLKTLGGIGPVNEKWLHKQGIFFFRQLAMWTPEEVAWVAQHLPTFGKRVYRENWVSQATRLASGGMTDAKREVLDGEPG